MRVRRIADLLGKDLALGPRSPLVLWALVLPGVLTLVIRGVFGGLLDAEPRLGVVDEGRSVLPAALADLDGLEVTEVPDAASLRHALDVGDLDAGLVLPPGFDTALTTGARPVLPLQISGRSLASDRVVVALTTLDVLREVAGTGRVVDVEVVALGDPGVPLDLRLLPLLVMVAVAIAGTMIPAASLVQEKEQGTLLAVLVTPAGIGDVLAAKGLLGLVLAVTAGTLTLVLNGVLTTAPAVTLVAIGVGGVLMVQVGLIAGCLAPDTNTLFAAWKLGGTLLFYPVVFFLWPDLPTWIARLGPTYYFLRPVYAANVDGAGFAAVAGDLLIAAVLAVALVPLVVRTGRRLERRLGAGRPVGTRGARTVSRRRPAGAR